MPADEKYAELEFPLGGLALQSEFQEQPPGTTPVSANCRATDPETLRMRGGSRMGSVRFVPGPVPSGANLIQHLAVIVDPQASRLPSNFIVPGDDWVEDPLNPGQFVPPGGWAYPPGPNPESAPSSVAFIQAKTEQDTTDNGPFEVVFDAAVENGQLIVVAVTTYHTTDNGDLGVTVDVENGAGTNFTQIGGYVRASAQTVDDPNFETFLATSMWYRVSTGIAADTTVDVSASANDPLVTINIGCLNYGGTATSGVLDDFSSATFSGAPPPPATLATGSVDTTVGGLLIGITANTAAPTSPAMTERLGGIVQRGHDRYPMTAPENPSDVVYAGFDSNSIVEVVMAASFNPAS